MKPGYLVTARTGKKLGAGTDAEISIWLVGDRGESGPHALDKSFHDDFERGAVDAYEIAADDLGELLAVRIRNTTKLFEDDWLLEEITVARGGRTWRFPFFRWVRADKEVRILEGTARLPQNVVSEKQRDLRAQTLVDRREAYRWRKLDVPLPGALDISKERPLPPDETYRDIGEHNYVVTYAETMGKLKFSSPLVAVAWNALEKTAELLEHIGVPSVASRWRKDDEFARQAVQGVNPRQIALATNLPHGMPLSEKEAYGLLEPGMTLEEAFAKKRMFLLDFEVLADIPAFRKVEDDKVVQRWAPPVRVLLFRRQDGELAPVAIQITREPGSPVFTPRDSEYDWMAAKMFARCAEGNAHQIIAHAIETHFSMEPFIVAALRNFPSQHPVYKLMRRHFRYTLAINEGARETLLAPNGVFDDFMSTGGPDQGHMKLALKAWANWKFTDARMPDDLRRRGVDDPAVLPNYPYRDDGLPIWNAIGEYVRATLGLFYASDADVAGDVEVQAFWADLVANGMPVEKMPYATLATRESLFDLVHTVIFNVSVGHSAVNNLQFEYYGWIPNTPLGVHRAPPTKKGEFTEDDVRAMMPSLAQTTGQIAIGKALSTFGDDEEFLLPEGGWSRTFFQEPGALAAQERLFTQLREQVARVKEANAHRAVPYECLRADRVPCSVTI